MSYPEAGVQINPLGGRGRGRGFNGRGRGYQGRGHQGRGYQGRGHQGRGYQGRGYQGNYRFNGGQVQNFQSYQNIPLIPKPFYEYLVQKIESKVDGKEELKYLVLNAHRSYVIRMLKLNSIITKELLQSINPGDDEKKILHFKRTYCSPNRIMNDGLFFELQKFINDISD